MQDLNELTLLGGKYLDQYKETNTTENLPESTQTIKQQQDKIDGNEIQVVPSKKWFGFPCYKQAQDAAQKCVENYKKYMNRIEKDKQLAKEQEEKQEEKQEQENKQEEEQKVQSKKKVQKTEEPKQEVEKQDYEEKNNKQDSQQGKSEKKRRHHRDSQKASQN